MTDCFSFSLKSLQWVCLSLVLCSCSDKTPQEYIQEGQTLLKQGETDSARIQFQNALQLDPDLSEAYYQLSLIEQKKNNWAGMVEKLLQCIVHNPDHILCQIKLGQVYLSLGEQEKAAGQADKALQIDANAIPAQSFKAVVLFNQNKPEQARKILDRILEKHPDNADALALKAKILAGQNQSDEAVKLLEIAIRRHPKDKKLYFQIIQLKLAMEKYDSAVRDYQVLLTHFPKENDFSLYFFQQLIKAGKSQLAEQILQEAIEVSADKTPLQLALIDFLVHKNPKQAEIQLQNFSRQAGHSLILDLRLADLYIRQKQYQKAGNVLTIQNSRKHSEKEVLEINSKLAHIALLQNNLEQAKELIQRALEIDRRDTDALMVRATLRFRQKDWDGVISDLRQVLANKTDFPPALMMQALANAMKGEIEVAEAQWRAMLERDPGNSTAILLLSQQLSKRKDYAGIEKLLRNALAVKPDKHEWLALLNKVQQANKGRPESEKALQQLLNKYLNPVD